MPVGPAFPPARSPLAWRIGVTGHRALSESDQLALRSAVAEVLALIRQTIEALARDAEVSAAYDLASPAPRLRILSPLADGADRLVTEEALRLGYALEVVLPLPQETYERTFRDDTAEAFRALLAHARPDGEAARILTLDGAPELHGGQNYRAVGRFIVRNCDLLVAIWDGGPAAGRGGTGDVVQSALAAGLPVWWIDPAHPAAARLLAPRAGPAASPQDVLAMTIRQAVLPAPAAHEPPHGMLGIVAQRIGRAMRLTGTPLENYLREGPPGRPIFRRAYDIFMSRVVLPAPEEERAIPPPEGPVETWWEAHHATAAALSKVYRDRYRSSYVLVFLFAAIALLAAALAFAVPHALHVPLAVVELLALSAIAFIVAANHLHRWQDRWISCRLLAELCRKQRILAPLGWTLPVRDVARIVAVEPDAGRDGHLPAQRDAWVASYFAAIRRACPMPAGSLAGPALEHARRAGRGLFADQLAYHRLRRDRSEAASRCLAHWGDTFFLFALVGVVLRIVLELLHAPGWAASIIGMACFASPAASAAFLGIRAYAEFELLARQSARMQQIMGDAIPELEALRLDLPLASGALGSTLLGVTTAMLLDIDGWAQLFQVKAVEAG